jgi:hypothetical protein
LRSEDFFILGVFWETKGHCLGMRRRNFIKGLISGGTMFASGRMAHAWYPTQYRVGLRDEQVFQVSQSCENWCWAACCQSVFATSGFDVPQEQFVQKAFGTSTTCATATGRMIQETVDGPWVDQQGHRLIANSKVVFDRLHSISIGDPVRAIADELYHGRPMLIGTQGHAMIITYLHYSQNNNFGLNIHSMRVFDPDPIRPRIRELSAQEQRDAEFLATVWFTA